MLRALRYLQAATKRFDIIKTQSDMKGDTRMELTEKYNVSFRCFYDDDPANRTTHFRPAFPVSEIPRWIDAYRFTHPNCVSISCKVWFANGGADDAVQDDMD